jgi:hypothetical protein
VSEPEPTEKPDAAAVATDARSAAEAILPEAATEPTGDALFDALWSKVLVTWDDDKAHAAVLEYALTGERLAELAGRYRALKEVPARAERAQKRLDAIVLAATQLMMSLRTTPNTKVPLPITLSVAGLFACAVAFAAYALLHRN